MKSYLLFFLLCCTVVTYGKTLQKVCTRAEDILSLVLLKQLPSLTPEDLLMISYLQESCTIPEPYSTKNVDVGYNLDKY